jgi:acetyl esterase/lipase
MKFSFQLFLIFSFLLLADAVIAQDVYNLWEGVTKPYYKENNLKEYEEEAWNTMCVFDITEPTLTIYKAEGSNSGKAVVIIPGGGYELVAMYHEGYDLAEALSKQGITAAVLKYRLPKTESSDKPELVPLSDARRALKLMRGMADKYEFRKNEVGVIGFSAGSHLSTVTCLWKSDDKEENPDFAGLIYGVTILSEDNQKWLEESLYHRKMTEEEVKKNTLLDLVTAETPPSFLVHSYDDETCKVAESTLYADKLFENDVPVEMHLFPKGGHGFGMGREGTGTTQWVQLFINWMKAL